MSAAARVWLRLVVMVALRSARAAEVVEWTPAEKTIYLLGNVPQSTQRAEWLGEYERQGVSKLAKKGLVDGRPYYANKADAAKFMWFNKHSGRWYVGKARAVGHAAGVLHVSDVAAAPEQITAKWQAWIGPQKGWIEAPELKVLAGEQGRAAVQADAAALTNAPPTLLLAGKTPGSVRHEWLGVYEKQSALVNRRHYYAKRADAAKMMWYSAKTGTWYVGAKSALGKQNGVLMAHDVAVSPERITPGAWTVGQGDGKGWIAAPELRCLHGTEESAALLAAARTLEASPRTVYLLGAKPTAEADASATAVAEKTALWQGAYSALIDETTGRPSVEEGRYTYTRSGPTGGVWSLWYDARRGAWYVSHRRSKRQAAAKAKHLLSAYDSAILPQQVRASWRKSLKGSWVSAAASGETVKVVGGEEGAALLREQMEATTRALAQSAESVLLVGIAAPAPRHEWMGRYVRHGAALVHGRHVLVHEEDETKVLWYDAKSASWCVAMHEALALQQMRYFPNRAVLRATDPSLAPERVAAPWKVREETSDHESWLGVPGLRCIAAPGSEGAAELRTQEQAISRSDRLVYLVGQTPPAFAREWMGPYERQALPAAKESSSTAGRRPSYRRQGDPSKLLTYNAHTGEWRAERPDATTGQPVTMMSTYDGAIVPERIAAPWRVFSDIGWEDAPEVRCQVGVEGKLALESDATAGRAADALGQALTPGWLFRVRKEPVLAALRLALQSGMRPPKAYALLSVARGKGVDATVLEAARQVLALAAPPEARMAARAKSFPIGQWAAAQMSARRPAPGEKQDAVGGLEVTFGTLPSNRSAVVTAAGNTPNAPVRMGKRGGGRRGGGHARVQRGRRGGRGGRGGKGGRGGRGEAKGKRRTSPGPAGAAARESEEAPKLGPRLK